MSTSLYFAAYRIPQDVDLLFRDEEVIPLEPLAVRALRYLAENCDRVVTKEELLERVWPDVFTTDLVLKRAVSLARRALDDDPKSPRFICTYHGRGYRFVFPVTRSAEGAVAPSATAAPPTLAVTRQHTNLPKRLTSFVGRERDMAVVWHMLAEARLVTLTGPGGVGKTRLALEVAEAHLDDFPDGVWLVDLATLRDPNLVAQTIAQAIGLSEPPALSGLSDYLRDKTALVLLDTCEHLVDACARVTSTLLSECTRLRLIVTSREVLRVSGEVVWQVPRLVAPPSGSSQSATDLMAFGAVRLFFDRAQTHRPDFAIGPNNVAAVSKICSALEGLPLAIELAAVRTRVLSMKQLESLVGEGRGNLRSLKVANREMPDRHQSLWVAIDWSYTLLDPSEQSLFRRLATFQGSFCLEAVEAVCGDSGVDLIEHLGRFVDKSLLVVDVDDDVARYRMLGILRQYASEKLSETGERDTARANLRGWLLHLAREAEALIEGPDQIEWLERLDAEFDNVRAVVAGDGESGWDAEAAMEICSAIVQFLSIRGYWQEGRKWLDTALERGADAAPLVRAKALRSTAFLASHEGSISRAIALYEESLALTRTHSDRDGTIGALWMLGALTAAVHTYEDGRRLVEEARVLAEAAGDTRRIASITYQLGWIAHIAGHFPEAARRYADAITAYQRIGHRRGVANSTCNLAHLCVQSGENTRAAALYEEAIAVSREIGQKKILTAALSHLGALRATEGDIAGAVWNFVEVLEVLRDFDDRIATATALETIASVASRLGLHRSVLRLVGAADTIKSSTEIPIPEWEESRRESWLGVSRRILGAEDEQRTYREGTVLNRESAIAHARDLVASWMRPENVPTEPLRRRRD
jgi:predicted ATPase/DNA-binding winged helix-turn-helix (wHTH) protein